MQNQGSLGPTTVAELLQTMQQERATGTLSLASNGNKVDLHFLFGHLFHAVGSGSEGEPAVIDALSWQDGEYNFNPRAKLPPEETINSSTEDLLTIWRKGPTSSPAEVKVVVAAAAVTPASNGGTEGDEDDWLESGGSAEIEAQVDESADIPTFQTPVPPSVTPARAFAKAAPPPSSPTPASRPEVRTPAASTVWPTSRKSGAATAPATEARSAAIPAAADSVQPPRPVAGATRSQLSLVIPMPSGSSLHSGLKASFLNFPMLLKTLSQDGFSGYVSIRGEKDPRNIGHILFREGAILQAQQRVGGSYRRSKAALQEIMRGVAAGEGLIDAIELPADLVGAVSGLIVANTLFLQLPSRIVDFDALVDFLEEQPLSGGILVTTGPDQVSVVLLAEGHPKGSYSSATPELTEGTGVASASCAERDARIDVVAAPSGPAPVIELAEIG
ncbi:MAG: DUF4388 domain-containing protein [Candidatus Dormiibacterota bacterium]|jgi:hypothetical protein